MALERVVAGVQDRVLDPPDACVVDLRLRAQRGDPGGVVSEEAQRRFARLQFGNRGDVDDQRLEEAPVRRLVGARALAVGREQRVQRIETDGGGTIMVEGTNSSGIDSPYAAAGHSEVIVAGDKIYHLYHAYPYSRNPFAELRIVEMPFDDQGWPVPAPAP